MTAMVFNAAYDALIPYTRHAQVRAELAERVSAALGCCDSPACAVEALLADWPPSTTRINRACLTEVVRVAAKAKDHR